MLMLLLRIALTRMISALEADLPTGIKVMLKISPRPDPVLRTAFALGPLFDIQQLVAF
jgi:hypothetical protein